MSIRAVVVLVVAALLVASGLVLRTWQLAAAGGCFVAVAVVIELFRRHWAESDDDHRVTGVTALCWFLGVVLVAAAVLLLSSIPGR